MVVDKRTKWQRFTVWKQAMRLQAASASAYDAGIHFADLLRAVELVRQEFDQRKRKDVAHDA